jgi:hypothetical protein
MKLLALTLGVFTTVSVFAQTDQEIISAQIREAQAITRQWMEKKKEGVSRRDVFEGQAERSSYIIEGIPSFVKPVNPEGVVYRHYVTGDAMPIILKTRQLKTGITPYVILSPGYSREVYTDLVGIFLTTPQTPPEKVGLRRDPKMNYIDFTLYEGAPVVEIEKEILLIPGRPDLPAWLKALYEEYKTNGRADTHYVEVFRKADERGGASPTFMRINLKSYSLDGKVINLDY